MNEDTLIAGVDIGCGEVDAPRWNMHVLPFPEGRESLNRAADSRYMVLTLGLKISGGCYMSRTCKRVQGNSDAG